MEGKLVCFPQVARYPAELLLVRVALELAEKRLADFHYSWDAEVVAWEVDGVIVSALSFEITKWNRTVTVKLGGTDPLFRQQGLYRKLWEKLVTVARERECLRIESAFHVGNKASRQMHAQLGRETYGELTRFLVPNKEENQ